MQNYINNQKYEILTENGWEPFQGVIKNENKNKKGLILETESGFKLTCTKDHKLITPEGSKVKAKKFKKGSLVKTKNGLEKIVSIEKTIIKDTYDIFNSKSHTLMADNISVSNCDELAFVRRKIARDFWTSIFPTLSCLTGDTWVLGQDGFRQIKSYFNDNHKAGDYFLLHGEKTWGKYGIEDISHGYVSPASKTFVIKTRTGHQLEVTKDHPLFTLRRKGGTMVKAKDLKVGDYLRSDIGMEVFGKTSIPANDAYMLGLYIAEGWIVSQKKNSNYKQMWISNSDPEIHSFLKNEYSFNGPYNKYKLCTGKSKTITKFIEYGLNESYLCDEKIIPEIIMQSDKKTITSFLAGLYDGDGSITHRGITLTSTSFKLIQQVKLLMNNLGFVSRLSKTDPKNLLEKEISNQRLLPQGKVAQSLRQSYNLTISNTFASDFIKKIPLKLNRKRNKCLEISQKVNQSTFKQFKYPACVVRDHIIRSIYESGKTQYWLRSNGARIDKIHTAKNFTYELLDKLKNLGVEHSLETGNYFWDEIISIKESYQEVTYDFTVPNTHSFLQNGVLGSNTGGRCIITSTPSDDESLFANIWKQANKKIDEHGNETEVGINGFSPLKIKWDEHPDRGDDFKEMTIRQIGQEMFEREHELEFIPEDETLIDPIFLAGIKSKDPIQKTNEVRWYKTLDLNKIYFIGYDPSLGTGGDYSAIEIFEFPTMEQVGEWMHNKSDIPTQLNVLKNILSKFKEAGFDEDNVRWTVENNTLGEAPLVLIEEYGEDEFFGWFMSEPYNPTTKTNRKRFRKGFTTTPSSKLSACSRFKRWLENEKLTIHSKAFLAQLKVFVSKGRTYAAKHGEHDDLIMAAMLVIRMAMEAMKEEDEYMDELGVTNDLDDDDDWDAPLPVVF